MGGKKFVHRLTQNPQHFTQTAQDPRFYEDNESRHERQIESRLKRVVLHYEAALIRIRDQPPSPSYGTVAWDTWLHWMTIAKDALKTSASPTLKQSNALTDEVERLRTILDKLERKHPKDVAKALKENP